MSSSLWIRITLLVAHHSTYNHLTHSPQEHHSAGNNPHPKVTCLTLYHLLQTVDQCILPTIMSIHIRRLHHLGTYELSLKHMRHIVANNTLYQPRYHDLSVPEVTPMASIVNTPAGLYTYSWKWSTGLISNIIPEVWAPTAPIVGQLKGTTQWPNPLILVLGPDLAFTHSSSSLNT